MTESLSLALQISLIGMGLVFGAILLLWGIMTLLIRVTAERAIEQEPAEPAEPVRAHEGAIEEAEPERKATRLSAAAVAVAAALALESEAARPASRAPRRPPTAAVSAWQTVMRGNQIKQRRPPR
jgi:Na+-transporting methylmalonyl-CoA/oxaloacetate decarboxylase gamma subunit